MVPPPGGTANRLDGRAVTTRRPTSWACPTGIGAPRTPGGYACASSRPPSRPLSLLEVHLPFDVSLPTPPLDIAAGVTRRARRNGWSVVMLCVLWAAGCGAPEATSERSESVDLLQELGGADVSLEGLDLITGPLGPAWKRDLLVADEMDGAIDPRWWSQASRPEAPAPSIVDLAGESALLLEASGSPVAMLLPSDPSLQYRIRVRWRAGKGSRGAFLAQALPDAPTDFDDPESVREIVRKHRSGTALIGRRIALGPGDDWQEEEIFLGREDGRRSLLLRLRATAGGVGVDRIEVRRLTTIERFVKITSPEPGRSPLYRRLRFPRQTCECLLLPSGTTVGYSVTVPSSAPRLDTETRILGSTTADSEIVVRVNGEVIGRRPPTGVSGSSGSPWRVDLERWAGRRVELELGLEGPRRSVGVLTAPRLLGGGDSRTALVLISLDTLRADHLGVYGETRPLSPNIDRLAAEGAVYERVVSPASYTLPTHTTILTGQHPLVHGVHRRRQRIDPQRSELLAVRLRSEGYLTAAFTGGGFVSPVFGFSRGFDQYSTRDPGVSEHRLVQQRKGLAADDAALNQARMQEVLHWMERNEDQPYFLFVHTYLVHGYYPQPKYLDRVGGLDLDPTELDLDLLWKRAEEGDEAANEVLRSLYAATVAQADDLVVRPLLEAIDRRREAGGSTLVALVSDHGEQFMEHGDFGHGIALWQELVHVPWILRGPRVTAGQRWREPVELADVAPTLLRHLGLSPSELVTGLPRLRPGPSPEPLEFVMHHEPTTTDRWRGLVTADRKLVHHQHNEASEWYLFDLEQDPGEARNLADAQPEALEAMRERMRERDRHLLSFAAALEGSSSEEALPASVVQELRALGYTDE